MLKYIHLNFGTRFILIAVMNEIKKHKYCYVMEFEYQCIMSNTTLP